MTNHSRLDSSLFEPGFEVDPSGPGRAAFVSPRARGSCPHHGSPRCPRNARLTMASVMINVYYPKQTLSPEGRFCRGCLFLDAINALTHLPSLESDARIKVRLGFLL